MDTMSFVSKSSISYAHRFKNILVAALCLCILPVEASIISKWNEVALVEVRNNKQGPPIASRALAIAHTCMYDAWTAYDRVAIGTELDGTLRRPEREHTASNKEAAVSYAAYRCLIDLYPTAEKRLNSVMTTFGYDPGDTSTDCTTAIGIGNLAAQAVIAARWDDGANQHGNRASGAYKDYTNYSSHNPAMPYCTPLIPDCAPGEIKDPLHWQPLIADNGTVQQFIAPHWEQVRPFALASASEFDQLPWVALPDVQHIDPSHFENNADELLEYSRELTDTQKLITEYWADGPNSELPPGHWGLFAQFVSQRDKHTIDQDAKMFFAMHNASFDAGIVGWHLKRKFDGVRPITVIRSLKKRGMVKAWGGPGRPIELVPIEKWTPYNPGSNLTPSFPGFVSGHSIFSRASSTVLTLFTGSDRMDYTTIIPRDFGRVEPGVPAQPTTISFATFSDAADEAGMSRLYAGIHFMDDNTVGQRLGELIGKAAFRRSQDYFRGIAPAK